VVSLEIELKVAVEGFSAIRKKLKEIHAKRVCAINQTDVYYDHPLRDFRKTHEILRIRVEKPEKLVLTYKSPVPSRRSKTRIEYEVNFDDAPSIRNILKALEFKPLVTVIKRRETWKLKDVSIHLDTVNGLGRFVEIEAVCRKEEKNIAEDMLFSTLSDLNLKDKPIITKSYFEMMYKEPRVKLE
jgi:adenylate cyclase class 2